MAKVRVYEEVTVPLWDAAGVRVIRQTRVRGTHHEIKRLDAFVRIRKFSDEGDPLTQSYKEFAARHGLPAKPWR